MRHRIEVKKVGQAQEVPIHVARARLLCPCGEAFAECKRHGRDDSPDDGA